MQYGYARVSTDDQDPTLQLAALKKAGCHETFTDHGVSGTGRKRPALTRCLKKLQSGDTLMVWKLDRLGRSVRDVVNLLHELHTKGVEFQSLTEAIDTKTPIGRAMVHMVAMVAELEHGFIVERTRAGIAVAKSRGRKFGPKYKLTPEQIEHARQQIQAGSQTVQGMADLLGVDRVTLWRNLR